MPDEPKAYWHMYHDKLGTFTDRPIEDRIWLIRRVKPEYEIETRLRLIRPMSPEATRALQAYESANGNTGDANEAHADAVEATYASLEKHHRTECPDCPWDGKTIFPEKEKPDA